MGGSDAISKNQNLISSLGPTAQLPKPPARGCPPQRRGTKGQRLDLNRSAAVQPQLWAALSPRQVWGWFKWAPRAQRGGWRQQQQQQPCELIPSPGQSPAPFPVPSVCFPALHPALLPHPPYQTDFSAAPRGSGALFPMFPFQPHSPPGGSGKELSRHQEPAIHWGIIPRALPALPWLPGAPTCTGMERERSALFDSGPAPSQTGLAPF